MFPILLCVILLSWLHIILIWRQYVDNAILKERYGQVYTEHIVALALIHFPAGCVYRPTHSNLVIVCCMEYTDP